jgi:epoxyqueuosine reductase
MKEILKREALMLGFDDIGFASADGDILFKTQVQDAFNNGRFGPLDYLEKTLDARLDIKKIFPNASSVIVVVKNYYTGDHPANSEKMPKIARYAWGKDYHQWFKKRLKKLASMLGPQAQVWTFNDTGPFLERAWAHKAGLGFIGKSAMFIHRGLGTWTLLGGFATDIKFEPDAPYEGPSCGSCTRCIDACPTQAITASQTVDARKCIATWTIERTLHIDSIKLAPRDHSWAFGCDICQEVCPWNKFAQITHEERFQPMAGRVILSKETFKQDLRGSPLYRTKKSGLLVNYLRIKKSLAEPNLRILTNFSEDQ